MKTRFFLPISKPKDGVNAEERHTFQSMQVPSSCCTFFQHSVLFSLWSIHCSGLFFFSSYVGSGLAMAISKDINEQWPALSSLFRNPDVLASQGKVSGKRVEIYNWTHITFFSPADRAIFPIPSTHRHTLTSAEQWEDSVIPIVQKKNFLLFFLIAAYSISRITSAWIQHCSCLARVCQAQRGL